MSVGEFAIIERYFTRRSGRTDVLLGVGDDAAILQVPAGRNLVVAVDTIVEDVHFPSRIGAADVGYRALAVNLSDLAAMGAEPAWMTLALSMPRSDPQWLSGFAQGLFDIADRHGVALVGGDTVRGPLVITVQVAGFVEPDRWLTRSGARAGDALFVSGVPGEAAAGLAILQQQRSLDEHSRHLVQRFLRPEPRLALGRSLRSFASAAMDVSDGLLTDAEKLCAASGCGAQIAIDLLPPSASMQAHFDHDTCVDYALAGGDDYEILFAVPQAALDALASRAAHCRITQIGTMTAHAGVECTLHGRVYRPQRRGYDHFSEGSGS